MLFVNDVKIGDRVIVVVDEFPAVKRYLFGGNVVSGCKTCSRLSLSEYTEIRNKWDRRKGKVLAIGVINEVSGTVDLWVRWDDDCSESNVHGSYVVKE